MLNRKILSTAVFAATMFASNVALANLALDSERSALSIISMKVLAEASGSVAETHTFSGMTGAVTDAGAASVSIPLDSVETNIPIRNERMAEFLFETDTYPEATVTADVPESALAEGTSTMDLDVTLSLHGKEQTMNVPVLVTSNGEEVTVSAVRPVMLDAAAFDLDGGLGKLTELAKLLYIPTTVPVSFTLVFTSGG